MLNLSNVTLIAVGSTHRENTFKALEKSREGIDFAVVKWIDPYLPTSDAYSRYILYDLTKEVDTDYALIVQHDGYVTKQELWSNEFFNYDYIGAPWPPKTHYTKDGTEIRVGNGGFSFRSKKMLDAFNVLNLEFTDNGTGFFHEDGQICNYYRKTLEDYGIKYAPVEIAAQFSTELIVPESTLSFGGHKYF